MWFITEKSSVSSAFFFCIEVYLLTSPSFVTLPITCHGILQIVKSGLMSKDDFDEARSKALSLFEYGQVNTYAISFLEAARSKCSDPPRLTSLTKLEA
jgi:hypothetical protein